MRITPVIIAAILLLSPFSAIAANYTLDPTHTYPNFTISHLGFSTMYGRFGKSKGKLSMDMDKGTGSVEITIVIRFPNISLLSKSEMTICAHRISSMLVNFQKLRLNPLKSHSMVRARQLSMVN